MSGQQQNNLSPHQEIQSLETMIHHLDSEIRNIENTIECQTLKRVTVRFLQVLKQRAEAKIQLLRENQN